MKVMTFTMLGRVRVVMVGNREWLATFTLGRRGTVWTALARDGRPQRQKHWTSKRDHRRRMARMAARVGQS